MFILSSDWDSSNNASAVVEAHAKYNEYLEQNKSSFPASAFEFATAEWHHDFSDHKALHDSWLAEVVVLEGSNSGARSTTVKLKLLGAYQDGHLNLVYENVSAYQLGSADTGHTSIDRDEVRLSNNGNVVHEIIWWQSVKWLIECEDIKFDWVPIEVGV